MNKTLIAITLTLVMASITFASGAGKLKNPKGIYPNKKPLISKTPTAVSVISGDAKHLKVRKSIINKKKVKNTSSIDRPKRLRRSAHKRGR